MKVIAKQLGEYPQGTWRQPGETFEFDGEKPALWMLTDETKAEKPKTPVDDAAFKAVHRGAGKWDVLNSDDEVVKDAEGLKKAEAAELVVKLLAELEASAE